MDMSRSTSSTGSNKGNEKKRKKNLGKIQRTHCTYCFPRYANARNDTLVAHSAQAHCVVSVSARQ